MDRGRLLNVVVTGQVRCGASVIQTSLQSCPTALCHPELLHPSSAVRKRLHEESFGPSPEHMPLHLVRKEISAEQYLNGRVFDRPYAEEQVVGVKAPYPHLEHWKLWEYLHERCQEGDFAVIHVLRNPLACFVSLKQAEQSGRWYSRVNEPITDYYPAPVTVNPQEFATFCREHLAHEAKLRQMVDDRLEISYLELFFSYQEVMREIFRYLEMPFCGHPHCDRHFCRKVSPGVHRMRNRDMRERISNFEQARQQAPGDVRQYFEAADLF